MNEQQELWTKVDQYVTDLLNPADLLLEQTLNRSNEAGLPQISVSAAQGKMLMVLAQAVKAKTILEIGTLAGYSTIWLARALPHDGKLVTLEYEEKHAALATLNFTSAGVAEKVEIKVGRAIETLPTLVNDPRAPFDLIFIDADKESYADYLTLCVKLSRPGTLIIADNVVRDGGVIDPAHPDSRVQGIRKFNEKLAADNCLNATAIQTVGSKGYDGFALIYVLKT
ncbi:MAG TPA: O-methyltransferase [Oculatellaceae cyanobacterium]